MVGQKGKRETWKMSTPQFNAWRVHHTSGRYRPKLDTLRLDDLLPGEVTIKAEYSSLNYKDALALAGNAKIMRHFPLVAGIDVAGTVETSLDPRYRGGDPVLVTGCGLGEDTDGGFSGFVRTAGDNVIPIPAPLDTRSAMQLGTAGFTAGLALHRMSENGQRPTSGPIAVTGATGGAGSCAIALFSKKGYRVVGITRKSHAHSWLKELGACEVLDPNQSDMGRRPLQTPRYSGAVDTVGGELLPRLLSVVDWWGNIATIGNAAGHQFVASIYPLILRGVSLLGINSVAVPRDLRLRIWSMLASTISLDTLNQIAPRETPLTEVLDFIEPMLSGNAAPGRIIVRVS